MLRLPIFLQEVLFMVTKEFAKHLKQAADVLLFVLKLTLKKLKAGNVLLLLRFLTR